MRGPGTPGGPALPAMAVAMILAVGCAERSLSDGPWVGTITRHGDTTIVRTESGSLWERPARLRRDLRIGALEGEEGTTFGSLSEVAVAGDGTIFVFDEHVPLVRRFDASGALSGVVGREGEGPGEYSDDVTGMVVLGDRLLVADAGNGRLTAYALDGSHHEALGAVSGLRSLFTPTLGPGPDGGVAVHILTIPFLPGVPLPTPWPLGLELRAADGAVVDTIPRQRLGSGAARVLPGPGGEGVLVVSSDRFLFEWRRSDGGVLRVETPFQRAAYTEGERRRMGAARAPVAAADGAEEAETPVLKMAYLEFFSSPDGRIWARRPVADREGAATWSAPLHQPSVLDAFAEDGRYLGQVPLPSTARPVAVTDTHLYTVELGSFDEPYLARYRVEVPGA